MMEELLLREFAGAGAWAALLAVGLYKFSQYNDKVIASNNEREERLLKISLEREERLIKDSKSREEKYEKCVNQLEIAIVQVAENQRILAEEFIKLRENNVTWHSIDRRNVL